MKKLTKIQREILEKMNKGSLQIFAGDGRSRLKTCCVEAFCQCADKDKFRIISNALVMALYKKGMVKAKRYIPNREYSDSCILMITPKGHKTLKEQPND